MRRPSRASCSRSTATADPAVTPGVADPDDAYRACAASRCPGLANAHSHAFQRALRGRTHAGEGSFWTWREQMYELAGALDPDSLLRALARRVRRDGAGRDHVRRRVPLPAPRAGRHALRRPERDGPRGARRGARGAGCGSRCSTRATCTAGSSASATATPPRGSSASTRSPSAAAARVGAAIHSVRAVDPDAARVVAEWAAGRPLHAHVSEQPKENEDALARARPHADRRCSPTPARSASDFTAIHATHLTDEDVALLGGAGATVCLCPTTERDLADGIGPARRLADAGAALATGSDSHAVIDPFEEARAIELDERLATGVRGAHRAPDLLRAATAGGYAALGWPERRPPRAGRARRPHHALARLRAPRRHRARARRRDRGLRGDRRRRPRRDGRRRAGSSATARTPGLRRAGRAARGAPRRMTAARRRQHRAARDQRRVARRGPARPPARRGARDRGRPSSPPSSAPAPRPTSGSTRRAGA